MLRHSFLHDPRLATRIPAHHQLVLTSFLMLKELSVDNKLLASVPIVAAFDMEEILKLVLERHRYLHELHSFTTEWTQILKCVSV